MSLGSDKNFDWRDVEGLIPPSDEYARALYLTEPMRDREFRLALEILDLPAGSEGLDVGCGIGLQVLRLAEAVGPPGHVTGLDISPAFIDCARKIAEARGKSENVSFVCGSADNLPFRDASFDWAWSVDCVGYNPQNPVARLSEMARTVRPGGLVAVMAWSSQQLLPGYPMLEARLNATSAGIAPFTSGMSPERHFMRALGWFREAGIVDAMGRSITVEFQAPVADEIRTALALLFDMRWGGASSEVSEEDWACYRRLCLPDSPQFILDTPDYYGFFTETMFFGRIPGEAQDA